MLVEGKNIQDMTREEKRRFLMDYKKKINRMSINEFDTFMNKLFSNAYNLGVKDGTECTEKIYKQALKDKFKIGEKRWTRLANYVNGIVDPEDEQNEQLL